MSRAALQREKLLNAIVFFTENTKHCHKLKLFKLLFLLDFEIFKKTGKTTTGLEYFAWPMGPVPNALFDELKSPKPDLRAAVLITEMPKSDGFDGVGLNFKARVPFDEGCFTSRELDEMARLVELYYGILGEMMTDVIHERGSLWDLIYKVEKKHQERLPFERGLDGKPGTITKQEAVQIADEAEELASLFK